MPFHSTVSNVTFIQVLLLLRECIYIYIYVDKRMGIWNIAKNSRVYFATNFLKLFTYFALLKYLICANLVSSSPFFFPYRGYVARTSRLSDVRFCGVQSTFALSIKNTIVHEFIN